MRLFVIKVNNAKHIFAYATFYSRRIEAKPIDHPVSETVCPYV